MLFILPQRMLALPALRFAVFAVFLCIAAVGFPVSSVHAETGQIARSIKQKKDQASKARARIKALTKEERRLNRGLAGAADKIKKLTGDVAVQEKELSRLAGKQREARSTLQELTQERAEMEQELAHMLEALWPVYVESRSGALSGSREWEEADRQYEWGRRLFNAIQQQREAIAAREQTIAEAVKTHDSVAAAAQKKLVAINKKKGTLLSDRLKFRSRLLAVRKQKESAETRLAGVLSIIQELNFKLEQGGVDDKTFSLLKGTMSWPAEGMLAVRFAPKGKPPVRGVGLALPVGSPVTAIAGGKVVHNDVLRGFGRVVIVLHGASYYSVYAYLDDSPLTVGQTVRQGTHVGVPGFYPAVDGPGLYFELRFHQKAINPETWLVALN